MVQIIRQPERRPSFGEIVGAGLGKGIASGSDMAMQMYLKDIQSKKDYDTQEKLLRLKADLEKQAGPKPLNALQDAQRRKLELEMSQSKREEDFLSRLMRGNQSEEEEYEPFERKGLPSFLEGTTEDFAQPKKMRLPEGRGRQTEFNLQDPTTWTDDQIRKFRAYKGSSKQALTLAKMAENEFTRRQETVKTREKTDKEMKQQQAVKQLLKETGKFNTEAELDEASKIYDLPTAKALWQESKKPKPKSAAQNLIATEAAKGYIAAKTELPKLQATMDNITRLRELGKNLRGIGGYAKAAFKTKSASEYNTLSASLLDPIIKVFNPVGAVPVTKLNWIRETFAPQASDLASTQEGKLATLERLASQAQQRAQQKIKLFNDYSGEPPESLVLQFDNDSAKMMTDFVDNQQYIDQLKKEVPKGKILMLDSQNKPLHVDPNQTMPNGMSAVEYATQFGARVIE